MAGTRGKQKTFFSGLNGAPRGPQDICYRCTRVASEHRRDIDNGRDRFVCPETLSLPDDYAAPGNAINLRTGAIVAGATLDEDRLSIAGAVARGLVGNQGVTIDQKAPETISKNDEDAATYWLSTNGIAKFSGGRRSGKSTIGRVMEEAAKRLKQEEQDEKDTTLYRERIQSRQALWQSRQALWFDEIARSADPSRQIRFSPIEPPKKKNTEPTVTIGAKRAYFEE